MSIDPVRRAVLDSGQAAQCAVLRRTLPTGSEETVAYFIPAQSSPARAKELLREELQRRNLSCRLVAVAALPLAADGEIDRDALKQLAVVDPRLLEEWAGELTNLGYRDVSVEEVDAVSHSPRIHWSDLSTLSTRDLQFLSLERPAVGGGPERAASTKQTAPAISIGPPLPEGDLPRNLAHALERTARRFPDHTLTYLYDDGSEQVETYEELLLRARRILGGLRSAGLVPGDKLIFQLKEHRQYVGAFWACQLGGFIPIPLAEAPAYAEQNAAVTKLHQAWQLIDRPLVLTTSRLIEPIRALSTLLSTEPWRVAAIEEMEGADGDQSTHDSQSSTVALLLLTSGSTGAPKAVMQSHRALLSRSLGTELTAQFEPDGVTLNWLPLDHVGGIVMCHISDVFVGCNEVLAEPEMILQQPLLWLDLIDRFRVTYTWAPNFAFALVNSQPHIHGKSWDLASLKFLLNGGEAIVPKVARRFLELLEPHGLPPTAMRPAWGMSETCSGVTYSHEFRLSNTSDDDHFTVVGRPIHGFSVRIANDSDEVLREGETGRLQVKGHCVTSGYYKDAERTDESFTADGWFVTGDLGVLRGGALSITGREKGVIIVNGLNYYSHEIESVVEEVPGVEVSFTAACPVRRSDGTTEEIAIFFARTGSEDGAALEVIRSISDSVRRRIGLNPGYVIPLMRDDIPKTEIGKIQRGELSDRFARGRYDDLLKELDLELGNERVIPNWFFRRVWKRKNLETVQVDVSDSPIVLIANNEQQVAGLLGGLASRNRHAATVLPGDSFEKTAEGDYRLDPHNRDHYRRLFEDLRASGANSLEILLLGPAGPRGPFDACERELSEVLLLSQALAASTFAGQHVRLQVCTVGAFSVSKEDAAPGRAVFNGLLKTLPQEYPWLTCRHVDLQDGDYDTALAELLCPQTDVAVAWRGGYRYVPQFERVAVGEAGGAPVALRRGGLYVLSGGAGGIGRLIAGWLIERFDARVLVVGRRHEDAVRSLLAGIGRLDETLFYRRADVCEQFELNAAVSGIEQLLGQPVSGAFHLAGTFEEAPIEELTPESLHKALRAKTVGTVLLAGLLAERPGAALILFSSVNGFFGGVSAAAYSAANAFVDEYAAYLAGRGQDVRACAWSLWDETGMSVGYSLKRLSRSRGFFVLQPHSGLASLDYALGRGAPALWIGLDTASPVISQHCVEEGGPLTAPVAYLPVIGSDVPGHIDVEDRFGTAIHLPIQRAPAVARTVEQGAAATVTEPMSQAERLITDLWARLLPRPPVGIDENFFDCGGNSISIARVNAELRKCMDRAVPMTAMFQHPSIRSLARYITADADAGQSQSGGEDSAERGARRRTKLQRRRRPLSGNKKRQ